MSDDIIHKDLLVVFCQTEAAWETWLANNHTQTDSVWFAFAKKASKQTSPSYEQVREQAIRFGWIDGLINKYNDDHYLIKLSPRRKKSTWSKINTAIATNLIKQNRMMPAGLLQVERAKADGRWQAAYDSQSTIQPDEVTKALLSKHPKALAAFKQLKASERYSFLIKIQTAKLEATKDRHRSNMITMLKQGKRLRANRQKPE